MSLLKTGLKIGATLAVGALVTNMIAPAAIFTIPVVGPVILSVTTTVTSFFGLSGPGLVTGAIVSLSGIVGLSVPTLLWLLSSLGVSISVKLLSLVVSSKLKKKKEEKDKEINAKFQNCKDQDENIMKFVIMLIKRVNRIEEEIKKLKKEGKVEEAKRMEQEMKSTVELNLNDFIKCHDSDLSRKLGLVK